MILTKGDTCEGCPWNKLSKSYAVCPLFNGTRKSKNWKRFIYKRLPECLEKWPRGMMIVEIKDNMPCGHSVEHRRRRFTHVKDSNAHYDQWCEMCNSEDNK